MVRTAFGQPHDKMGRVKLLIIRHGQSANNLLHATTGSYAGREADPLLTELGRLQAARLAEAMVVGRQPAPQVLYTSLMSRAVQTAAVIAETLDIEVHGRLDAFECGGPYLGMPEDPTPYCGAPASALRALSDRLVLPAGADETGWYRGDGEDDLERAYRGARVIHDLKQAHLGTDRLVALVCHEWISQHLVRAALGFHADNGVAEPWLSLNNTGTIMIDFEQPVPVTEATHDGGLIERVLEWHNNTSHLLPEQITG